MNFNLNSASEQVFILIFLVVVFGEGLNVNADEAINFEPIAMDESVKLLPAHEVVVSSSSNKSRRGSSKIKNSRLMKRLRQSSDGSSDMIEAPKLKSPLLNLEDSDGKNIDEKLFELPGKDTKKLTQLITNSSEPFFVQKEVAKPNFVANGTNPKVLANYKLVIPILLPAVTTTNNSIKAIIEQEPVRYDNLTQVKLEPMRRDFPYLRTVMKAERLPQKIVTDYVKTLDGPVVPSRADDKLRPNERLVKTVVTNYA